MKNFIFIILISFNTISIWANTTFQKRFIADGNVTSLLYENNKLYASTDNASICIFNTSNQKLEKKIKYPPIKDFAGNNIPPKVYDFDKIKNKNIIIAATQGQHGFSNVFLYKNGINKKLIIDGKDKLMIKKIRFITENLAVIALLSNEIILFNISLKKQIYRKQISPYTFSDIALSEDKKQLITADESGIIHLIDTKTAKSISELSGNNVDNVYQIDFKNNIVACGGQDRRLSVYNINNHKSYYIKSDFLIYSVGLSPSGKYLGYSANENNDIKIIYTQNKHLKTVFKAHNATITKILFIAENKAFTSAEEKNIYYWELN